MTFSCQIASDCHEVQFTVMGDGIPIPPLNETVGIMFLDELAIFLPLHTLTGPSVTINRNQLSSDQWTVRHVFLFHPCLARHHNNLYLRWYSRSGRLMTHLNLNPAVFRQNLAVLVDKCLCSIHWCFRAVLVANELRRTNRPNRVSSRADLT